ncbi:serine protease 56 [Uranotaenia lowii]|uniref:serine protease 56 n=1 Tax=Uranotaenia lowii TaxID=190385 RepID=UPI00247834D4|nr:serine protease 56 [Uranotaenia lowii]
MFGHILSFFSTILPLIVILLVERNFVQSVPNPIKNGQIYEGSFPNGGPFPFAASLQRIPLTKQNNSTKATHFCGGTYIGLGWIVTANHCVTDFESHLIYAILGGSSLDSNDAHVFPILEKISYPSYDGTTLVGDIAMLRINISEIPPKLSNPRSSVGLPNIFPVRNDQSSVDSYEDNNYYDYDYWFSDKTLQTESERDEECQIFGYGADRYNGPTSKILRFGQVQPIDHETCSQLLGLVVAPPSDTSSSGMFCAMGIADACQGDSGSGLVCRPRPRPIFDEFHPSTLGRFILRGVISYGAACGTPASPGVYTDVRFYMPWIRDIMNKN